jgi:hypothetical protein
MLGDGYAFGQMPQLTQTAGPSGFGGDMSSFGDMPGLGGTPGFGGGMFGPPQKKKSNGLEHLLPYLGFGLLGGSLLGGNMGMMAPLFGLAGIGLHKAKVF